MPCRVLIAEHNETARTVLSRILTERLDLVVETVSDSDEALRRIAQCLYEVIITELDPPGISGMQLMKLANVIQPGVAVIIVTEFADAQMRMNVVREGAYDALLKPIDVSALVSTVRHAANAAALMRQIARLRDALAEHTRDASVGTDISTAALKGWPKQLPLPWIN